MADNPAGRTDVAMRVTLTGLLVNVVLVTLKYTAGFIGRSGAMIADATHSLSDLITDVALVLGFTIVGKPPDEGHRYGHGKVETLAAAFCGGVLFLAGLGILLPAVKKTHALLFNGQLLAPPGWIALAAALLSVVSKEVLYRYTLKEGKLLDSPALIANAWHHRSDAFSSIGTALGIGGAILGGSKFAVLDPIAAAIVSLFIFKASWSIMLEAVNELLEASIGEEGEHTILEIIAKEKGVLDYHRVCSRRIGYYIAIEAHIKVDKTLCIVAAHDIATNLEKELRRAFGQATLVNLHVEPFYGQEEQITAAGADNSKNE